MNRFEGGGGSDSRSDICKCNEDWRNKIKTEIQMKKLWIWQSITCIKCQQQILYPKKKKKRNQKIKLSKTRETIKNFKSQENKINKTKPLQKQHTLQQP